MSGPVEYPNHVGGQVRLSPSQFKDRSPNDENMVLGLFQNSSMDEVKEAVSWAKDAFGTWSLEDHSTRTRIFENAAQLMRRKKYELAAAISLDNGKNRYEAIADVDEAIDFILYYCHEIRRNDGFLVRSDPAYPDEHVDIVMRPYGTWAVICPFNFPLAITTGMTTGALITGNTAVLKPSSSAPLPVYMFYEILARSGLPDGVLNFIAGPGSETGNALVNDPRIDGIVFTGSKKVGIDMIDSSHRTRVRPVIAEMGSKNPTIVTSQADLG